nr:hypothetical protein K-LCC10_0495 [Kaumoebavirus]
MQPEINTISASIAEELKNLFAPVMAADVLIADQPLLIPAGNHHIIATTGRQAFHLSCTFREPAVLHLAPGPYRLWSKKIIWAPTITSKL